MPPRLQLASSDRSRKCPPHACLCSRHPHGSALISFRPLSSKTSHLKQQALPLSLKCTYYSKTVYFKLIMIYCSFLCLCVLVSMCGQFLSRTGDVQTRGWVQGPGHPFLLSGTHGVQEPMKSWVQEECVFRRECSSDLEPAESTVFTAGQALVIDSCQFRSLGRDREGDGP